MPLGEIKDFNVLVDNKPFFYQSVKNKQEGSEKLVMGNVLDYSNNWNYFKLIGINLSRQTNTTSSQHINFAGKLKENDGATMFL